MLDFNLLPVFEAMLHEQNVTAAAGRVGLTQSAMSNALGRLRQEFGDPLFVRTRDGMLPTPRALELAPPLMEALALIRASTEKPESFDPLSSTRSFRLFMSDVGEMRFLPGLMEHLRAMGSTIRIQTSQIDVADLPERMAVGDIDLALGFMPKLGPAIHRVPLFDEHYVCLTRESYGADGGKLTLKRFIEAQHIAIESMGSGHQLFEQALQEQGIRRNIALRVPHFVVIPMIVAETDLIVTVPARVASRIANAARVRVHPLPLKYEKFEVSLFWHPRFARDPAVAWLRELLTGLFQEAPYLAKSGGRRSAARRKANGSGPGMGSATR